MSSSDHLQRVNRSLKPPETPYLFIFRMNPIFNLYIRKISSKTQTLISALFAPTMLIMFPFYFKLRIYPERGHRRWSQLKHPPKI